MSKTTSSYNDITRLYVSSQESQLTMNINPNILIPNYVCHSKRITYNVESLSVPMSYFNFHKPFTVLFEDTSNVDHVITFSVKNYTLNEFFDELVAQMTLLDTLIVYTWSQVIDNKRIDITGSGPGVYTLQFPDKQLSRYVGAIQNKLYESNIDPNIRLDYIPDFTRTKNFVLTGNLRTINTISYDNNEDSKTLKSKNNIFGVFPIVEQPGDEFNFHRGYYGNYSSMIPMGRIFNNPLTIELRDDDLELIDTNGQPWTMCLFLYLNY